jgi:hypothetical protein
MVTRVSSVLELGCRGWRSRLGGALLGAAAGLVTEPVFRFTSGLIWAAPNSKVSTYVLFGDNPGYLEYHWRGVQDWSGNAYVLAGLALLILLAVVAVRTRRASAVPRA